MASNRGALYRSSKSRIFRSGERLWIGVTLTLISLPAYAQASDPISRLLTKAVDLLTNRWAVASAVVTIAVMGYRMKYGMMDKRNAFVTIFGIVIVFGAALLVEEIRG
jgi:type IV secretory pathway VirB2 component (pilin)